MIMTVDGNEPWVIYANSECDAEQMACAELLREVCEFSGGGKVSGVNIDRFTFNDCEYTICEVIEVEEGS